MTTNLDIHRETEDIRRKMLDSDVVPMLLVKLEDEYYRIRLAALDVVRGLAKAGESRE